MNLTEANEFFLAIFVAGATTPSTLSRSFNLTKPVSSPQ